ncbi:MAG TPA: DUF4097 family beta strand repeat-containing protein [Micromonosporaceae bacterium]|nr:DUF4097 family beta strand repeat-containing protein [Micromonosporaceae bacterium]
MPEFPVTGPIAATIRISAGSLRIVAESRDTVDVDVRPGSAGDAARQAAAETIVEMTADGLLVETPQARGFLIRKSPALNITVRLPSDSRIMARSASADVSCEGRLAGADINTASGDLRIEHVTGDLARHSASGDTQFSRVDGTMNSNSASGDLRGGTVGGDFTTKTASGDVTVDAVGGSVRAASASGDFHFGNVARGTTTIHSASGDVFLGIAEGTAVWMDVSTLSGDTVSDLNVTDSSPGGATATLELSVRTVSGDVTIRRATSAPAPYTESPSAPANESSSAASRSADDDLAD